LILAKSDDEQAKGQPKTGGSNAKKPKTEAKAKPAADIKATDKPKPKVAATESTPKTSVAGKAATRLSALGSIGSGRDLKGLGVKIAAVAVALIAVVVVIFGVLVYVYKSESPAVKVVAQVVPYPVERVNSSFISYNDYLFEVDANERAYQNNAKLNNQPAVDFKSADGKKLLVQIKQHSLDKLKSDALIAQLASEKHVKVTDKEINDLINQLYQRYGGKDTLLKTLKQIYGWDINDLKKVVRKQLLAKNLEEKVTSDPTVDATAKAKAQDVLKKVKDGGDFAELAKKNSQASDAASGGDLGFFTKGQLPDNLQSAAEALQPDQVSDVVKTQYGYEIIKVIEKKDDGSIHAQHILIKTVDFNEYFQEQLKKAKVNAYIKA
jgi:foldase protein PrsA